MEHRELTREEAVSFVRKMDAAASRMQEEAVIDPKVIRPIRYSEETADIYARASGADEAIDWTAALERLRQAKEE